MFGVFNCGIGFLCVFVVMILNELLCVILSLLLRVVSEQMFPQVLFELVLENTIVDGILELGVDEG